MGHIYKNVRASSISSALRNEINPESLGRVSRGIGSYQDVLTRLRSNHKPVTRGLTILPEKGEIGWRTLREVVISYKLVN